MKTKNTSQKLSKSGSAASKSQSASKSGRSSSKARTSSTKSSSPSIKKATKAPAGRTIKAAIKSEKPKAVAVPKVRAIAAKSASSAGKQLSPAAVSVAERLTAAKMVKSAEVIKAKSQKANLKLVAKARVNVPCSKISRLEPTTGPGIRSIGARYGASEPDSPKPILAARAIPSEPKMESARVGTDNESFRAGDKIVYPKHGVGEIEGIHKTVLGGQEYRIYNIKILDSGMKCMVPVDQACSVGLRRIIDKKAIDQVFEILKDRDFKIDTQTWNRRFREYSQKIQTGSVFEIAVVLRDLSVLSADKELSFGEKKMLDMAESLLVSEIAIAKSRPHDKVVGELRALFA